MRDWLGMESGVGSKVVERIKVLSLSEAEEMGLASGDKKAADNTKK